MENSSSNWQDSLNHSLVNRLTRPLRQPGMMKMAMGQRIINRYDRFLNRLPLLNQQMQRWGKSNSFPSDSTKIVYAQPVLLSQTQGNIQPTVSQNNPSVSVIQRKLDSSQISSVSTGNPTPSIQTNFADDKTQSRILETQINQPSISTEIPVVSPEAIAMPLQAKLANSNTSAINSPSASSTDSQIINQPSISTEIPVVSPEAIASLPTTAEMPLQPKSANSNTSAINSPSASNTDSQIINQPSISTEIPVVSPQAIFKELTSISQPPLPITQIKQEDNYSRSQLPIVNRLFYLTSQSQIQKRNNSPNLATHNPENLSTQISSNNLPVVPVTTVINLSVKPQSLLLAKTASASQKSNQQPNSSNGSQTVSSTDSLSSLPQTFNRSLSSPASVSSKKNQTNVDVDTIANQVERKLMRRLVIESERRGKNQWH